MEHELKANLRSVSDAFLAKSALAMSTVWARAVGDARFLERIDSGKGFTAKTYDRALAWFSANWPSEAGWPSNVARPAPTNPSEASAA